MGEAGRTQNETRVPADSEEPELMAADGEEGLG